MIDVTTAFDGAAPATLKDADLIAIWEAAGDEPSQHDLLVLAEIERRNLDF